MRVIVAGLLALILTATACRGGDDAFVADEPCTNEATIEAIETRNRGVDFNEVRIPDDEAHCRLRRALLTLDDLPDRWEEAGPGYSDRTYGGGADCGVPSLRQVAGLTAHFLPIGDEQGDKKMLVAQFLWAFEREGSEHFLTGMRHSCEVLEEAAAVDPEPYSYRVLAFPDIGDDTLALHFGDSVFVVYFRRGDVVSAITSLGLETNDIERLARLAESRMSLVGEMPERETAPGEGCVPPPKTPVGQDVILDEALLKLDDMPSGWIPDPPGYCGYIGEGEGESCEDEEVPHDPIADSSTGFLSTRASLTHVVELYSPGDAESYLDDLTEALVEPSSCSATIEDGVFLWSYTRIDLAARGDQSIAWLVRTEVNGEAPTYGYIRAYVVVTRIASSVTTIVFRPKAGLPGGLTEERMHEISLMPAEPLIRRADEKLAAIQDELAQ